MSIVRDRWVAGLPTDIPEKGANLSLMQCVVSNLPYDGQHLTSGLSRVLPNAGYVRRANCITLRPQPAKIQISDRTAGIEQRNIEVYNRLLLSVDSKLTKIGRREAQDEISRCWVAQLQPIAPDVLETISLTPCFCIEECRGAGLKRRMIDDYKMSGINDTTQ